MKELGEGKLLKETHSVRNHEGLIAGTGPKMEGTIRSATGRQWKVIGIG